MDFYYDSINMREPKMGSVTSGNFTPASTTDYMGVVMDDSYKVTTNFTGSSAKGIRFVADVRTGIHVFDIEEDVFDIDEYVFDMGTASIGTATHLLIHRLDSTNNPTVEVWGSDDSATNYTRVFNSALETGDVWSINTLDSSTSNKYFVVQFTGSYNVDVGEIILAQKISDLHRYGLSFNESLIPSVKVKGSYDGAEFTNFTDNNMEHRTLTYEALSQTYLNKLKSLREGIYNRDKWFLFDDGTRRFGKLQNDIDYTEVAYKHYSAILNVRNFA